MSEQEENVESEKLAEDIRQIKEMGSVTLPDAKHVIHCLNIIEIGRASCRERV